MLKKFFNYFRLKTVLLVVFLVGCAGMQRDCAGCNAGAFGADWVVVQMDMNGRPFRCWTLRNTSISNEEHSDGIWWQSPNGNLVHISGLYNRVQVSNGNWSAAYQEVGLTENSCRDVSTRVQNSAPASQ